MGLQVNVTVHPLSDVQTEALNNPTSKIEAQNRNKLCQTMGRQRRKFSPDLKYHRDAPK